ncbi:hypothetical protein HDU93_004449, partial [Gonapodya sp. JEL0774]
MLASTKTHSDASPPSGPVPPPIPEADLMFLAKWTNESDLSAVREHVEEHWKAMVTSGSHMYGCMKRINYVSPKVIKFPTYQAVLAERGEGKRFLEIGCSFGADVRAVLNDGWPGEDILALDVTDDYWKSGMKLFKDESNPPAVKTLFGDITDDAFFLPG